MFKTVSVRFEFFKFIEIVLLRGDGVVKYNKIHTADGLSSVPSRRVSDEIFEERFLGIFHNTEDCVTTAKWTGLGNTRKWSKWKVFEVVNEHDFVFSIQHVKLEMIHWWGIHEVLNRKNVKISVNRWELKIPKDWDISQSLWIYISQRLGIFKITASWTFNFGKYPKNNHGKPRVSDEITYETLTKLYPWIGLVELNLKMDLSFKFHTSGKHKIVSSGPYSPLVFVLVQKASNAKKEVFGSRNLKAWLPNLPLKPEKAKKKSKVFLSSRFYASLNTRILR